MLDIKRRSWVPVALVGAVIVGVAAYGPAAVIQAVIPQVVPTANKQGNGTKFQLAAGSFVSGNCQQYDANGNTIDAGSPCGGIGAGITQLTQDVLAGPGSGSVAATVAGINAVPLCTGFTPTNGQFLQYTTGLSPNPCYTAAAGGGGATLSSGTFASIPGTCTANSLLYFITDSVYSYAACTATNTYTYYGPLGVNVPPPSSGWTWDNQASGTIDSTNGYEYMVVPKSGTVSLTGRYRTAPGTPYTITALLLHDLSGTPPGSSGTATNGGMCLSFRDGTGKISNLRIFRDASGEGMVADKWTTSTSFSAAYAGNYQSVGGLTIDLAYREFQWLRLADNGTNLTYSWSVDGQHWNQFFQVGRTDWFASGPTQVGFFTYANGVQTDLALASWRVQ
jgi:hypothetical protein